MKYDTWVTMEEIRPIGEIKYAAHAHIRDIGKGDVQHGLGESWGRTREEAESKMNVRIQEWLEANK
jgi:hypothetical protein